jgi:HEAT repeat protein
MLNDKDVEVRVATVASMVDLKTKRTIASLHKALKDDVPEVSFAAAKALWVLNDPEGKQALLSVVGGETPTSSRFITKQKRDAMRLMHTPKPMFLFAFRTGVGFAPVPGLGAGISSMQGLLSVPGVWGRATAALLLGRDKDKDTLDALKDALIDRDWSVRAAAVHSLALRNDPSLEEEIAPLLDDKKEAVRLRAAAAYSRLEMIKHKPAVKRAASPAPAK